MSSDMGQRLRTYKRVSSRGDEAVWPRFGPKRKIRYGRIPESVEHLFAYARLRQAAEDVGVVAMTGRRVESPSNSAKKRGLRGKADGKVRVRDGASFTPAAF